MIKTVVYEGKVLARAAAADTFIKRLIGYMCHKEPHHEAILFEPCNSIHTFLMKFAIDVLFVDENMRVVKKLEKLQKGKMIMPVKEAKMVIEGRAGLFEKVKEGDRLTLI